MRSSMKFSVRSSGKFRHVSRVSDELFISVSFDASRDITESSRVRDRWTFVVRKQVAPDDENENFSYKFFFFFFFSSPLPCWGNCQQQERQLLINCWIVASGRSCRYNPLIKTQSSPFATNFPAKFPSLLSPQLWVQSLVPCVSRSMWRKNINNKSNVTFSAVTGIIVKIIESELPAKFLNLKILWLIK